MENQHANLADNTAPASRGLFERFSSVVTKATGSSAAFNVALLTVTIWAVSGPFFHYSEN